MRKFIWISLLLALVLTACAEEPEEVDPAPVVESYLNAMVNNEEDKIPSLVCGDFERDARTEFDAFGAVDDPKLEGLQCTAAGNDGEDKLVSCEGIISAVYNGEPRDIDLAGRTYRLTEDDGEWKVCG